MYAKDLSCVLLLSKILEMFVQGLQHPRCAMP